MTREHNAATRRIMNRLGEDNRIPIVNVREGDVGVLLGFPLGGLLAGSVLGADLLAIGLLLAGFGAGVTVVYATPAQQTAWDWLTDVLRYAFARPRVSRHYRTEAENASTAGGVADYVPFTVGESTQELTNVERAWPGVGAIQRTDGTMEAFLELEPSNMDFAMSDDWLTVQRTAEEFANTELDFPLTFYATTQSFPADRLVRQLDDRLTDPDVEANPVFRDLLEEYQNQRPADLDDAQQLHYYLGVEVDRLAVYQRYGQERTPGEKLTEFPLIGFLFNPFVTRRENFEEAELRAAMFEKLDDRIRTVRTEFIENVSGWSGRRLTTLELFVLQMEFWNGEEYESDTAAEFIRSRETLDRTARDRERPQ